MMDSSIKEHYLSSQIIAYIGNKRRLLPLVREAFCFCTGKSENRKGIRFLDLFAGSGVVSRLAKTLGYMVIANDWEYYSYILNKAYIETDYSDIEKLFGSFYEFSRQLDLLNTLAPPSPEKQYMALYYAPRETEPDKADFRTERLFYTRENALRIDSIRNFIEEKYYCASDSKAAAAEKIQAGHLLTGMLLYKAATHTNTSGVFKAYHNGFGGHGRDALSRILKEIKLEAPPLVDSEYRAKIYMEDAASLAASGEIGSVDIAYLDPPYNQHQYGSNYHILNTIARWDRIPAPLEKRADGRLREKAAIRKDWINTRSPYCCRQTASDSFRKLLGDLDAGNIIVSYSTDGIIPFDEMKEICASRGKLSVLTNEYTKYRGGRQSNSRVNTNIEFVILVETKTRSSSKDIDKLEKLLARKKISLLLLRRHSLEKLNKAAAFSDHRNVVFNIAGKKIGFMLASSLNLVPDEALDVLNASELSELERFLEKTVCVTREEELKEILVHLELDIHNGKDKELLMHMIPGILRKLAHRKTRESFYLWLEKVYLLGKRYPDLYLPVRDKIKDIEKLAGLRFNS